MQVADLSELEEALAKLEATMGLGISSGRGGGRGSRGGVAIFSCRSLGKLLLQGNVSFFRSWRVSTA